MGALQGAQRPTSAIFFIEPRSDNATWSGNQDELKIENRLRILGKPL